MVLDIGEIITNILYFTTLSKGREKRQNVK